MKNKGVFQVLRKGNIYKIVYIEKGEIFVVYSYEFKRYDDGLEYIKTHKEELNKVVTEKKEIEQKRVEKAAEEREAEDAAVKVRETEKEKKKKVKEDKKISKKKKKEKKKQDREDKKISKKEKKEKKKQDREDKKEERKKRREERREKVKDIWAIAWVKFVSGALVMAMLLTGGHFLGKGISRAIKGKETNKPGTTQTDPTVSTTPTEPTIDIENDKENIITYEEIYSTEKFENMVVDFAKPYVSNKLSLTTEDLLKFASIINIDRLVEENPEFAKELFGSQTAEEYLNDAAKTIGVTYMYNHTMWEKDKNTDNFIWISSSIPEGDSQKEKMVELEGYVTKIAKAAAEGKEEEVNKLTSELIQSLTLPDGSLNALDDGVEFAAQLYFALINNSIARNYLKQEYRDYFDTRSSAEQNVSNIFTIYNKCNNNGKVRTRSN